MPEAAAKVVPLPEARPAWTTKKVRAEDLATGDVTRNRYGKWDVVTAVHFDGDDLRYIWADFEVGGRWSFRAVDLLLVQTVKPS